MQASLLWVVPQCLKHWHAPRHSLRVEMHVCVVLHLVKPPSLSPPLLHLHPQAYYLAAPFAIERAPTAPLALPGQEGCKAKRCPGRVRVERLLEYPVRTLVFEAGDSLAEVRLPLCVGPLQPRRVGGREGGGREPACVL